MSLSESVIKEKIQTVIENKEVSIAALKAVLDTIYNYIDPITNDKGNIKTALFKDKRAETFAVELKNDTAKYEKVMLKLQKNDFNLSISDIGYINAAYVFCINRSESQIQSRLKTHQLMLDISKKLTDIPNS